MYGIRTCPSRFAKAMPDHDDQRPGSIPDQLLQKYRFAQHGQSGMWISELLPWTCRHRRRDHLPTGEDGLDRGDQPRPGGGCCCTGNQLPGRPSLGSWLSYGLPNDEPEPTVELSSMTASWTKPAARKPCYNRLWGPAVTHQAPGGRPPLHGRPGPPSFPIRKGRRIHPPPRSMRSGAGEPP